MALLFWVLFPLVIFLALQKPSHSRDWELGQEKLPQILVEGDEMSIKNLRDFHWKGPFLADPNYIDARYSLDQMQTVDVVISHFDKFEGWHIYSSVSDFLTDDTSASPLKHAGKKGKSSPTLGLLRQFEIIYVVGTDNDLLGVRTGPRKERVYIYPTISSAGEGARSSFRNLPEILMPCMQNPFSITRSPKTAPTDSPDE